MFRKSVLLTVISTAAVALAANDASARGAVGSIAGARAANPGYVPHINVGPTFDKGFVRPYARSGGATIKWSRFNAKVSIPYVNPNGAVQIKPNYSTLKPLPINPVIAAEAGRGSRVYPHFPDATPPASPMPSPAMHWPHQPGFYGTPASTAAPVITSGPDVPPAPASVSPTPAVTTTTSTNVQPLPASLGGCTCLTKQYTPQGAVVFMDRCTNEVAVAAPQRTGALAPNQMMQPPLSVTK